MFKYRPIETLISYIGVYNYLDFLNPAINYSLRVFYFFHLIYLFKYNNLNINLCLKIFSTNLDNFWFCFLATYNLIDYIFICLSLFSTYFKSFETDYFEVKTSRYVTRPSSFLVYNNLKLNSNRLWSNTLNDYKNFLINGENLLLIDVFQKIRQQKFWVLQFNNTCDSNFSGAFILSFLRVQRRYNKRRYSRVRAYSRAPFFSGISLSSLLVSSFFNSNIKNVDWSTSLPVVVDINFVLFITLVYFFFRFYKTSNILSFLRQRGRLHVSNIFSKVSTTNLLISWFNRFIK